MTDDLQRFDSFLGAVMEGLAPARRKAVARKIGQALRRANLARIAANVQPDGSPMEPRKPRRDRRGRLRAQAGGKMFRRLRLAREWKLEVAADSIGIEPSRGDRVAAEHHFGMEGFVGRAPDGSRVRTQYPERRLLGFAPEDEEGIMDAATSLFDAVNGSR